MVEIVGAAHAGSKWIDRSKPSWAKNLQFSSIKFFENPCKYSQ